MENGGSRDTEIEGRTRAEEKPLARWWLSSLAREEYFRAILDPLPTLVTLITPDGEVKNANRQVLEYFGASFEELERWPVVKIHC